MKSLVLTLILSAAAATSVSAKTLTYDFAGHGKTADTFSFVSEGVSLDVGGASYHNGTYENEKLTQWQHGFGISSHFGDRHLIDGFYKQEFVTLAFSEKVDRIGSLTFDYVDRHDKFAFYGLDGDRAVQLQYTQISDDETGKATYLFDKDYAGSFFAVGALKVTDDFKLRGLTASLHDDIAPVPLPAAMPLLLAGIGGLGFLSRRRNRRPA